MTTPAPEVATITSVAEWKKSRPSGIPLRLPSGNTCLVKRPGLTELLAEGMFPDSLMGLVSAMIDTGQGKKKPQDRKKTKAVLEAEQADHEEKMQNEAMSEIMSDPTKLKDLLLAIDKIAVYCLVDPQLQLNRDENGVLIPDEDRDEELLYADGVDDDDKMEVFNFCVGGEAPALATFPNSNGDVGTVRDSDHVAVSTK